MPSYEKSRSYVAPTTRKLPSHSDSSPCENIIIDIYVEIGGKIEDFIYDEFRRYFRKWNCAIWKMYVLQEDEDGVQYCYVERTHYALPFIARYMTTTDKGSKYRLYIFEEVNKSKIDISQYDFDEQIERLTLQGIW